MSARAGQHGVRVARVRRVAWAALAVGLAAAAPGGAVESWGPELNVSGTSTDSEWGLTHHGLTTTPDGTLHLVWAERDGPNGTYRIWTRERQSGAWSVPERIVDYLATDPGNPGDDIGAKYPSLAASPNGDLHLFWHDYRVAGIDNVELFWKRRPAGGAWDPSRAADVRLTTSLHAETAGQNAYVPVAAAADDGTIHVAWYDYRFDASSAEILSKTLPPGGAWNLTPGDSADERVSSDPGHSELVAVAVDGLGVLHAVWRSVETGGRIRYAARDPLTGGWSSAVLVDGNATVAGAPAAAIDGDGALHVVWPDSRDGGRALFTRTLSAAGVWSPAPVRITRPSEGADEPSLACAANGTLHLVFSDGRVSLLNREVFHRENAPGAPWDSSGAADDRISNAAGNSTRPNVDVFGELVTIAWKDTRDGNHEVYVRFGGPSSVAAPHPVTAASTLAASPNPVRAPGAVRLTRGGPAASGTYTVLDVRGMRVRDLAAGADGGTVWDLRRESGGSVPSGVYFIRAADGSVARLTVLR